MPLAGAYHLERHLEINGGGMLSSIESIAGVPASTAITDLRDGVKRPRDEAGRRRDERGARAASGARWRAGLPVSSKLMAAAAAAAGWHELRRGTGVVTSRSARSNNSRITLALFSRERAYMPGEPYQGGCLKMKVAHGIGRIDATPAYALYARRPSMTI